MAPSALSRPPSSQDVASFITAQLALLFEERKAEVEETALLFSKCSPKLLEQQGVALLGLGVAGVRIGLGGMTLVELDRPNAYHTSPEFPSHSFRPGDLASIVDHNVDPTSKAKDKFSKKASSNKGKDDGERKESKGQGVEGVVFKVSETRIVIAVGGDKAGGGSSDDLDLPERCRVVKLANDATFDRMEKTLHHLAKELVVEVPTTPSTLSTSLKAQSTSNLSAPSPANPLFSALLGFSSPTFSKAKDTSLPLSSRLNESQQKAVRLALSAEQLALVHGPPGTGKTSTVVEIIRQEVAAGKRLLVCAASNLAVDNILERLLAEPDQRAQLPLTRLGHPARVLASLHQSTLDHQTTYSNAGEVVREIKREIEALMAELALGGKARVRGLERKKKWEEVKELRKDYRRREATVTKDVIGRARVVLATCHGAGSRQLHGEEFDVIVIDEAAQALEAACWIPILKGASRAKLILAGDHLQLPPTIKSVAPSHRSSHQKLPKEAASSKKSGSKTKASLSDDKAAKPTCDGLNETKTNGKDGEPSAKPNGSRLRPSPTLETTLFDRLLHMWGDEISCLLTTQYRMNAEICSFPSRVMYGGRLHADESCEKGRLGQIEGVEVDEEEADGAPIVFIDTAAADMFERADEDVKLRSMLSESKSNEHEAHMVVEHVVKLVTAGLNPSEIAVIAPYAAQVSLIASLLRPDYPEVEVGTVDGFQGREAEAVILSLVRSNDKREVGFLAEKRRLNVAMTRPKKHLAIIGDSDTVSKGSDFLAKWMDHLQENALLELADAS